jgi:ribose/xylose/arabinose/galactoside ABC-type transport system permease subunit
MQSREAKLSFKTIPWGKLMVYIVFIVVFILFSILLHDKGFLGGNLLNIVRQTAMVGVMAVAGTFVIACGQIDLTVGSVAAMSAMIAALILQSTGNIFLAVVVSVAFGLGVGWVNGFLVTRLGLPSFLATLGMMEVVRGLAMWITNTAAVPITNNTFNQVFGTGYLGPISVLIIWMAIFFVVGYFLFNKTPFGRHTLAVGGNETAAGYSGINTKKVKMTIFMMSGAFAAFAGILYAGRMQSGRYTFGDGDEMSVIAAVVLGGAAMSGGTGSIIGTLFGALLMGMISNALVLAGLSSAEQTIVSGAIIILAVALSNVANKKKR